MILNFFRVQEVVDPNYSPSANLREMESTQKSSRARSKSAPSGSPKGKKKGLFKKNKKEAVEESFPTHVSLMR